MADAANQTSRDWLSNRRANLLAWWLPDAAHAKKLTVHILAAVAQHEREAITERTKDALRAAKARGMKLGNPHIAQARRKAVVALKASADHFAANVLPIIRSLQRGGTRTMPLPANSMSAPSKLRVAENGPTYKLAISSREPDSGQGRAPR